MAKPIIDKGLMYTLIFSFFWSLEILVNKIGMTFGGVSSPSSYTLQVALAQALFITGYMVLRERGLFNIATVRKNLKHFVILGLLLSAASLLSMWGLKLSTSINYGFIVKSTIIFVPLFAVIFLKDRLSKLDFFLISAFLIGLYLLSTGGVGLVPAIGDLLIIATAICYAATMVYQKSLGKINSGLISWGRLSFPLPFILAYALLTAGPAVLRREPLLFVAFSGAFSVLGVIYLSRALREAPATYVSMISMSVPVMNLAFGYLFVGESLNLVKALGAAIILGAGTVLIVFHNRKRTG